MSYSDGQRTTIRDSFGWSCAGVDYARPTRALSKLSIVRKASMAPWSTERPNTAPLFHVGAPWLALSTRRCIVAPLAQPSGGHVTLAHFKLLIGFLILCAPTLAQANCFKTVREIKVNNVKTRWQETTENDGKPMTISIANGAGGLVYSAQKAGQLWLSGNISVCRSGGDTAITMKNTKTTPNVPMIARMAFPRTQSAQIVGNRITLTGGGWTGSFVGK